VRRGDEESIKQRRRGSREEMRGRKTKRKKDFTTENTDARRLRPEKSIAREFHGQRSERH